MKPSQQKVHRNDIIIDDHKKNKTKHEIMIPTCAMFHASGCDSCLLSGRWKIFILACMFVRCSPMSINVWYDSSNVWHRDIQYHPEQPSRIEACVKAIYGSPLYSSEAVTLIDVTEDNSFRYSFITEKEWRSEPFSEKDLLHAKSMLQQVHGLDFVSNIEDRCRNSKERRIQDGKDPLGFIGYLDPDTYLTTESFGVCLRATATWIRAVDLSVDTLEYSMALTRPPGHHATANSSNGFCIFNFAATAAMHFCNRFPGKKCSIIDWDVHYGQGVANIVQGNAQIRYVSVHQSPAFPYLGTKKEVCDNNVMTIPVPAETTWTCGYKSAFEEALQFVCTEREWEPDLVIVCAGFDALDSDELASCSLSAKDFERMTLLLKDKLHKIRGEGNVPIMLGLEGGYQLSEMAGNGNLPDAVLATLAALSKKSTST